MKRLALVRLLPWAMLPWTLSWPVAVDAGSSHSINAVATDAFWSCETSTGTTAYVSAVFRATASHDDVQTAFTQVLAQKYGYTGAVGCSLAYANQTSIAKLESDQKARVAQLRGAGRTVVETGWAMANAAASADDKRIAYFCEAQSKGQTTLYQSRLEVAKGPFDESAASQAWSAHVTKTFGLDSRYAHAGCTHGPMSVEQVERTRAQQAVVGMNVVEVDWTFAATQAQTSPPPTVAAPAVGAAPIAPTPSPGATPSSNAASAPTSGAVAPTPHAPTHAPVPPSVASTAPTRPSSTASAPSGGATAASPPTTPPRAKNPWVCQADAYSGTKRTHYISGAFDSEETQQQLAPAWRAHLVATYRLPGQVVAHCGRLPKQSEDAIEASLAKNQNVPLVHDAWQP
jgi:hypothetical protein